MLACSLGIVWLFVVCFILLVAWCVCCWCGDSGFGFAIWLLWFGVDVVGVLMVLWVLVVCVGLLCVG